MVKTNQLMTVRINEDLTITIYHKSKLGKVDDILSYGNFLREQRGLRPIRMENILKKQDFWEFVIARNTQNYKEMLKSQTSVSEVWDNTTNSDKSQTSKIEVWDNTTNSDKNQSADLALCQNTRIDSDYSILEKYKTNKSEIRYNELIKQFPHLIKSQRGGKVENRGYWLDLYLLLKIGAMLDKDLEVQIYDVFIKGKILEYRDAGGNAFKELNRLIDTLEDRTKELKPEGNKGVYIQISKLVRDKLKILETRGYNKEEHDSIVQSKREKIIDFACSAIKMQMIKTYPQLKTFIINYPI